MDMNGDGLPDRVGSYNHNTNEYGLYVALNTGSGFGSYDVWLPRDSGPHYTSYIRQGNSAGILTDLIDMNGDGLPDRVGNHNYLTGTTGLHVALNTGNGFGAFELWLPQNSGPHNSSYVRASNTLGTYLSLMDMNGDGLPDRVGNHNYVTGTTGLHVALNTGSGFGSYDLWLPQNSGHHNNSYISEGNVYGIYSALMDMNGDGLPDRVSNRNALTNTFGLHVSLNNGNGFEPIELWLERGSEPYYFSFPQHSSSGSVLYGLMDINGDGLPDRVGRTNPQTGAAGLHVALNTGSGFGEFELMSPLNNGTASNNYVQGSNNSGIYSMLRDINGDGLLDRLGSHNYQTSTYGLHAALSQGNHPFISAITDSSGNRSEIHYKPLTDSSVYTKGSGAVYPLADVQSAIYVVSQVETSNGIGGTTAVHYNYEGLKTHIKGRGSYGYSKITETYPDTGKQQITTFDQRDFPYTGSVLSVVETLSDPNNGSDQTINEVVNTWVAAQNSAGGKLTFNLLTRLVGKLLQL